MPSEKISTTIDVHRWEGPPPQPALQHAVSIEQAGTPGIGAILTGRRGNSFKVRTTTFTSSQANATSLGATAIAMIGTAITLKYQNTTTSYNVLVKECTVQDVKPIPAFSRPVDSINYVPAWPVVIDWEFQSLGV